MSKPAEPNDWADRFPAIVAAALRIQASSFLIDGEAVIGRDERPALWLLDLDQRWHASRFEDRNLA